MKHFNINYFYFINQKMHFIKKFKNPFSYYRHLIRDVFVLNQWL